jgi:NAD(P)-dependent dehydrogenase (short-subunit alcohol dehydrogenase family)
MTAAQRPVMAVTGGAGGIGATIVKALVAHGAAVVVSDWGVTLDGADPSAEPVERLVDELNAGGGRAVAHFADITTFDGAAAMVELAVATFGRLDGLVTSHGIFREGSVYDIEPDAWGAVIGNHLTGTFTCLQPAMRRMREQGEGGSVVCVTSSSGFDGNPIMSHYSAAKGGITSLIKSAALSGGADGINVNGIIPNAVTRVTTRPSSVAAMWWKGDAPTAELGAKVTVALLGPDCRHISGQVFTTSGDRLARWSEPVEERAERRASWDNADVLDSLTGFMDCRPLRRFTVYGYPQPGAFQSPAPDSSAST